MTSDQWYYSKNIFAENKSAFLTQNTAGCIKTLLFKNISNLFAENRHHNIDPRYLEHFYRAINGILSDELASGVHALSIVAKTPKEFEQVTML
jgi:hypothetical protein